MYNMKNIIAIVGLAWMFTSTAFGQTSFDTLMMKGIATQSDVRLRWMPKDYQIWQKGVNNKYRLERTTIYYQDSTLDFGAMSQSRVVLSDNITPLSATEFESNFPSSDSIAYLAKELMYSTELEPVRSDSNNLADAVAYNENIESKFMFSMIVAEQSFDVAQAQGLGFIDTNVSPDYTYLYKLFLETDTDTLFTTQFSVKYTGELEMPAPLMSDGIGGDSVAYLQWYLKNTNQYYNFFNIERSVDNVNFELMNEVPFAFMSELEDDPEEAYYTAALPENGVPYYFRVVGLSPFGVQSPPSDTIEVIGVPSALKFVVTIDSLHEANEGHLTIDWSSVSDTFDNKLSHFDIYTKMHVDGDETKLNTSPINPTVRQYEVMNAPSDAYYRLEAIDVNGHVYTSLSFAGHIKDSTPPAAPMDFKW